YERIDVYTSCYTSFTAYSAFFLHDTATTEIYTLSLHDALPISAADGTKPSGVISIFTDENTFVTAPVDNGIAEVYVPLKALGDRSEEHTSELQSPYDLVCRLLLEKKKINHLTSIRR